MLPTKFVRGCRLLDLAYKEHVSWHFDGTTTPQEQEDTYCGAMLLLDLTFFTLGLISSALAKPLAVPEHRQVLPCTQCNNGTYNKASTVTSLASEKCTEMTSSFGLKK